MAALNFIAGRARDDRRRAVAYPDTAWTRLDADIRLASGTLVIAIDAYDA